MTSEEVSLRIELERLRVERKRLEIELQRERNRCGMNMQAALVAELAAVGAGRQPVFTNSAPMDQEPEVFEPPKPAQIQPEMQPVDWDDDDREFFSKDRRSTGQVAKYLGFSQRKAVLELIEEGKLTAQVNPDNGYNEVFTSSVREYLFHGETTKKKDGLHPSA